MSSSTRSRAARRALLLVVLASVTSCVQQAKPGVDVKSLQADLVFGVTPLARPATPANFQATVTQLPGLPPPAEPPPLTFQMPSFGPPLAAQLPCPPAGLNDFPKEAAATNVAPGRRPLVGLYRWVRKGTRQGADTAGFTIPIAGFEKRLVQHVTVVSDTKLTFETVQSDVVTRDTVTTTWQVVTNGTTTAGQVAPPAGAPAPPSAGDPERGVTIKKIVRTTPKGATTTFAPTVGLLVLPLPVRVGEQFTSTAVDPTTFQTIQFQGTVGAATRLNACGEVVEAWPVSGTQTFTVSSTESRTYTADIAPQLGGLLVGEKIDQTGTSGTLKVDLTIGQLTPDKAPSGKT
jgi:hypothetical protein